MYVCKKMFHRLKRIKYLSIYKKKLRLDYYKNFEKKKNVKFKHQENCPRHTRCWLSSLTNLHHINIGWCHPLEHFISSANYNLIFNQFICSSNHNLIFNQLLSNYNLISNQFISNYDLILWSPNIFNKRLYSSKQCDCWN